MGRSVYNLLNGGTAWDDLTEAQQRRYSRDAYYYKSAGKNRTFVNFASEDAAAGRAYSRARQLQ
eukprot:8478274-Karenia_brevis.AAC.1